MLIYEYMLIHMWANTCVVMHIYVNAHIYVDVHTNSGKWGMRGVEWGHRAAGTGSDMGHLWGQRVHECTIIDQWTWAAGEITPACSDLEDMNSVDDWDPQQKQVDMWVLKKGGLGVAVGTDRLVINIGQTDPGSLERLWQPLWVFWNLFEIKYCKTRY